MFSFNDLSVTITLFMPLGMAGDYNIHTDIVSR